MHTDPYFDPDSSTTSSVPKCNYDLCELSQSYSEGSSWKAYKVKDKLWVGGLTSTMVPKASDYSTNFQFACLTSETGLFRSQLADGIMGMSNAEDTLVPQLFREGVITKRVFSLCFRVGGGIMTIGGLDPKIHTDPSVPLSYAKLIRKSNWFTLNLLDLMLETPENGAFDGQTKVSITKDVSSFNLGKGVIVDSGTTDTFLPAAIAQKFKLKFMSMTGINYDTTGSLFLTAAQLKKLPTIVFVFEGLGGAPVEIRMPWNTYAEK
jgi:hypothetical protein